MRNQSFVASPAHASRNGLVWCYGVMINNHYIRFIDEAHTSISQPVVKFKRGNCLVLLAKICHNPGQLYLTPPSSPSGLSSDVNGRLGATKLSNAARPRHFCLFSTSANRHKNNKVRNLALPPMEPVFASIALDHKLGHVVR